MGIRWKKARQDFLSNKSKTVLVILAIFFGVFGTGLILNCYSVTKREMDKSYMDTNPASFVLRVDPINDDLLQAMEQYPGIEAVEARRMVRSRTEVSQDKWLTTNLYVIDDFGDLRVDKFWHVEGNITPAKGEIVLEKEALPVAGLAIGNIANVKIPLYESQPLIVTGVVHAPGLKPAWMEQNVYGFTTDETLSMLGIPTDYSDMRFVVSENRFDKAAIRDIAFAIRDWCEANGYTVDRVEIPTPGKHPNGDQMNALLFLFQVFGILSLVLSGVLVVNMVSSMLNGQIRQIAIMKSIGAKSRQIAGMYYVIVLVLGLIALVLAVPLAMAAANGLVGICASMLNFTVESYRIPLWSYALQFAAGLLVPALAATYPIIKGCNVTINDALRDYGMSKKDFGKQRFDRLTEKIRGLNRPLILSIRNTFRRRGRLILTVGTLAVGGAILIVALNVKASLENTINNAMQFLNYDIQYTLSKNYPEEDIQRAVENTVGVYKIENFAGAMSSIVFNDGTESNFFQLIAPPDYTESLNLPVLQGRWIAPDDTDAVVINHTFLDKNPSLKLGDKITLRANGIKTTWTLTGVVKEVGANERAYVNQKSYQQVYGLDGMARMLAVINEQRDKEAETAVSALMEQRLRDAGLDVLLSRSISDVRKLFDNHLTLIAGFLVAASILIIIVGVMGLLSSMSMSVMERMREMGVMRSIGALPRDILHIVIFEGVFVGILSWIIACLLSMPLTFIIGNMFGGIFLQTPLDNVIDPLGIALWLILIVVITVVSGYVTAKRALNLPVNEILSYE